MRTLARFADKIGIYRPARWVHLRTFRRNELTAQREMKVFYQQLINPDDLVFDVGANRGAMTQAFLGCGARVVAFEPHPDMCRSLRARIGPHKKLAVLECALGAECGNTKLHIDHSHPGSSSVLADWPGTVSAVLDVPVSTLDAMIVRYGRPAFIKIDVEGFELAVLRGLSTHVPLVSLEYTRDHATGTEKIRNCIEWLGRLGCNIKVNITPAEDLKFALPSWIPASEFLEMYPEKFPDFKYRYGDLFVSSTPLSTVSSPP